MSAPASDGRPAHLGQAPPRAGPATPATVQTLLAMTPPRFSGSLPLWYQLAQSLRTAILSLGQDGPTRLPTEVEFARTTGSA